MSSTKKEILCLIDGPNLFFGNKQSGIRMDYRKLESLLAGNGQIHKTYFFNSNPEDRPEELQGFYTFLEKELGWTLKTYNLGTRTHTCPSCKSMRQVHCEKGVDVGIAMKMLQAAASGKYKKIFLVSGDGDFHEIVQLIQNIFLIPVQIVAWKKGLSQRLDDCSSLPIMMLDDYMHRLVLKAA